MRPKDICSAFDFMPQYFMYCGSLEYSKPVLFLIIGEMIQLFLFGYFPKGFLEKWGREKW